MVKATVDKISDSAVGTVPRMMEAAIDLYAAHGYKGTSLQMIADAIGVTKAAVYYHFKSKTALLSAVIDHLFIDFSDHAAYIESRSSRSAKVLALTDFLTGVVLRRRQSLAALSSDAAINTHPQYTKTVTAAWDRILRAVEGPNPSAERRVAFYLAASVPHTVRMLDDLNDARLRVAMSKVLTRLLGIRDSKTS
jgi:AcrR family transcriptional regulator